MDPCPACCHCGPGRFAAGQRRSGSGKIAVLTERAVQLITDPEHPVDADQLLIVTFTNAAAAGLHAQAGAAAAEPAATGQRSAAPPADAAAACPICTIDAFCLDLLHKHFQALDLPPDFVPSRPRQCGDPAGRSTGRDAGKSLRGTRISAPLQTCTARAAPTRQRAGRSCRYTISAGHAGLSAQADRDADPLAAGKRFCRSIWQTVLLEAAVGRASAAVELLTGALADCQEDFAQAQEEAACTGKAKKIDAVKEKFAEPLERLDLALGLLKQVEQLARQGMGEPVRQADPYVLGMEDPPGLKK